MNEVYFGIESFYFYFFIFLVFYVIGFQGVFSKNSQRKQFFLACFLLLYAMAALRGITVGGDLKRYLPEFHGVAEASFDDLLEYGNHEPGYMLFIRLLGWMSDSDRCFLVGTSLASLIGPFYMFYKYSKQPVVSILLYYAMGYYTNTFNNVRQSIAISIIFCTLPFLLNRNQWKYILGVLLATSFHYSAAIMLIVYPLCKKPLEKEKVFLYAVVSLFTVFLTGYTLLRFIALNFLSKYDPESFEEIGEGSGYGLFLFYALIFVVISRFYVVQKRKIDAEQQKFLSLFVLFQLFAMTIQLSAPIHHSMVRMTYYFFIPIVTIAVPYIYSIIPQKVDKAIYYMPIFAFAIYYMIHVYSCSPYFKSNSQAVIPYVLIETTIF